MVLIVQADFHFNFDRGYSHQHHQRQEHPQKPKKKKKNHYKALRIKKDATQAEIKRAFRKLSLKYHPDKITDPALKKLASRKIIAINEAYEILGDPDKRQLYDDFDDQENFNSYWEFQMAGQGKVDKSKGFYTRNDDIIKLKANTFIQTIRKQQMLVEFYAPWCTHCKDMVSDYGKAAVLLSDIIKLGAVNCVAEEGLCEAMGINQFPKMILYHHVINDKANCRQLVVEGIPSGENGVYKRKKKQSGGKPYYRFGQWYLYYYPEKKQWIIDRTLGDGMAMLFVTDTADTPDKIKKTWSLWNGKKWAKNPNINIRCKGSHTVQSIEYEKNGHSADLIYSFVDQVFNSPLVELTAANFDQMVINSTDIWLVDFSAGSWCGPCSQLKGTMRDVAFETKGMAQVGIINCDSEGELCAKVGITFYPQLRIFSTNSKSGEILPSEGMNPAKTGATLFGMMMKVAWNHNWTAAHSKQKAKLLEGAESFFDDDDEFEIRDDDEEDVKKEHKEL